MAWFKRQSKGIQTPTEEKKDIPKGLWYKSPTGKIVDTEELQDNFYVSPEDDYHVRIGREHGFYGQELEKQAVLLEVSPLLPIPLL